MKKLLVLLMLTLLFVPAIPALAQDDPVWTCDGGKNDVLNAALAAEEAGDIERALELAIIAEDLCQPDFMRWREATQLRQRLQTLAATPDPSTAIVEQATELNLQGQNFVRAGQYEAALNAFEEALALVRQLDDPLSEAVLLGNLGETYRMLNQPAEAARYFQNALQALRSADTNTTADQATITVFLALTYLEQNAFTEALTWITPVREQAVASGNIELEYRALLIETVALAGTGQLQDFSPRLALIDALAREVDETLSIDDIALLEAVLAVYQDPPQTEAEWAERFAQANGNPELEITILLAEAEWHETEQRFDAALDTLFTARDIARNNDLVISEAQMLQAIGQLYNSADRPTDAINAYAEARDLIGDEAFPTFTMTLYALEADVYFFVERYERSAELMEAALDIAIELENADYQAFLLNALGVIYLDIDRQQSDAYFEQATALAADGNTTTQIGERIGITAGLLDVLTAVESGDIDSASDLLDQVAPGMEGAQGTAAEYFATVAAGALAEFSQELSEAEDAYTEALTLLLQQPPALAIQNQLLSSEDDLQGVTPARGLARVALREGNVEAAWQAIEQERAFATSGALLAVEFDFSLIDDAELLATEADLRTAVQDATQSLEDALAANDASAIQQASQTLRAAQDAYRQHLERMRVTDSYRAQELSYDIADLDAVRAVLPPDTTLIVYVIDDAISPLPPSYALLLTRERLQAVPLRDVTRESVDALVTGFNLNRRDQTNLSALHIAIFAPLADHLTTSNLIIVPDRSLNYVPFAALQDEEGNYLVDQYVISYATSATSLVRLQQREQVEPAADALVVSQSSAPGLPDLRFAAQEAENVAATLNTTPILNATETQFREQAANRSSAIVISAHAELNPTNPLFSTIHLGADDQHDGRLEVREIYQLELTTATELVVLSGCETGSGQGDDFGLLNRAFLGAGASRVVASLWSVDDEATAFLVSQFVALRAETASDAEALQQAMLATRAQFPDPYFWASFTLTGLPPAVRETASLPPLEVIPGGDALVVQGVAALEAGQYADAVDLYTQALAVGWVDADTYNRRGVAYVEMGEYTQAIPDFDAALARNDTFAQAYVNRGVAYYNLGEYEQAIADYSAGLEHDPDNALTHSRRGTAYFELGDFDAAITDYTAALELDDTVFWYAYNRGLAYYETGRYAAAIDDFTTAIALDDTYTLAFRYRGDSYAMLGENDAADADYTRLIDLLPDDPGALQVRGMWRFIVGDVVRAQQDFEAAIELAPEQFIYYYWAGLSAIGNGDLSLAQTQLEQAAELLGENPGLQAYITLWRGVQARAAGDEARAVEFFVQAQAFNDSSDSDDGTRRRFNALLALVTGDVKQAEDLYAGVRANNPQPHQGLTTSFYFAVLEATFPDDVLITSQAQQWRNRSANTND